MSTAARISLVLWGSRDDGSVVKPAYEEDPSSGPSTTSDHSQAGKTAAPGSEALWRMGTFMHGAHKLTQTHTHNHE